MTISEEGAYELQGNTDTGLEGQRLLLKGLVPLYRPHCIIA